MNPKQKIPLHEHALNRVVVYLKPQKIKVTPDGGDPTEISPAEGEVRFSDPGRHTEENLGDGRSEVAHGRDQIDQSAAYAAGVPTRHTSAETPA